MSLTILLTTTATVIAGYLWTPDPEMPICDHVEWVQVSWEGARESCGYLACASKLWNEDRGAWGYNGCRVFSGFSEQEARRMIQNGESLYDHEARHILQRLVHPSWRTAQVR